MDTQPIFEGEVVRGNGRGRALGFPTANITIRTRVKLPQGIWASWCRLREDMVWRQGALHVGPRPTFQGEAVSVELHILDFPDRDLYGEVILFVPIVHIREVERFASEEELRLAIAKDCERAREL